MQVVVCGVGGGGGSTLLLCRFKASRFRADEVCIALELRSRVEARDIFFDIEIRLRCEAEPIPYPFAEFLLAKQARHPQRARHY